MSLEQSPVRLQDLVERLPCSPADVCLAGEQDELLTGQDMPEPFCCAAQLSYSDLIEGLQEMPDHVELIVDNLDVGTVRLEAVPERLPHVEGDMGDKARPLFPEPPPEPLQITFPAPFGDIQHLGSARTFKGTDQGQVVLTFTDGNLIGSQNGNAVQGAYCLDLFQGFFVDPFDGFPMQIHKQPHRLMGHYLTQFKHHRRHRASDAPIIRDKRQPLHIDATFRALHPVSRQPQDGTVLPQREVFHFDIPMRMRFLEPFSAYAALEHAPRPFQVYDNDSAFLAFLDCQAGNSVSLNTEKCGKIGLHRVAPLVDFLPDFNARIYYPMPSFLPTFQNNLCYTPFLTFLAGLSGALEGSTSSQPVRCSGFQRRNISCSYEKLSQKSVMSLILHEAPASFGRKHHQWTNRDNHRLIPGASFLYPPSS